ncbi:MAG: hypothetical protein ABWY54_08330 [Glaciihabitans sp.]
MTNTYDPAADAPDDDSLAVPVGGNALNPDGEATHNEDKLGAGTPAGTPQPNDDAGPDDDLDAPDDDDVDDDVIGTIDGSAADVD